jgi:hypothetical protein
VPTTDPDRQIVLRTARVTDSLHGLEAPAFIGRRSTPVPGKIISTFFRISSLSGVRIILPCSRKGQNANKFQQG